MLHQKPLYGLQLRALPHKKNEQKGGKYCKIMPNVTFSSLTWETACRCRLVDATRTLVPYWGLHTGEE